MNNTHAIYLLVTYVNAFINQSMINLFFFINIITFSVDLGYEFLQELPEHNNLQEYVTFSKI